MPNQTKINFSFRENMDANRMFDESFLARALSISPQRLQHTAYHLKEEGEIMLYDYDEENEFSRKYKLEDAYVVLTKYKGKKQQSVLDQFKREFFHG